MQKIICLDDWNNKAASRFASSQWETALLCNDVSHCLGANFWAFQPKRFMWTCGGFYFAIVTFISYVIQMQFGRRFLVKLTNPMVYCSRFMAFSYLCLVENRGGINILLPLIFFFNMRSHWKNPRYTAFNSSQVIPCETYIIKYISWKINI